jgi:hypothetical protein
MDAPIPKGKRLLAIGQSRQKAGDAGFAPCIAIRGEGGFVGVDGGSRLGKREVQHTRAGDGVAVVLRGREVQLRMAARALAAT